MLWLAAHMWILLAAAFVLGLAFGWWIWGLRMEREDAPAEREAPMGTLQTEYEPRPSGEE